MLREETDHRGVRLAAKIWRKLWFREQWFLLIELPAASGLRFDLSRCKAIHPPADRLWADPFVHSTPEAHFVFVEELLFSEGKGHIAVLELSRDGAFVNARKVLERPYHLSYPFVFRWRSELYMLPESGANRTVELYRCVEFPDQWVLDTVLLSNVHAADATMLEHENRWWLFMTQATAAASIHEQLCLYSAATPLGPFKRHPANPVKSTLRGARPAGALFAYDGALYRPAQDCTRVYGEAVILQRVDELSDKAFRESEQMRVAPDADSSIRRVHTLNAGIGIRVMDALRWIPKWQPFRRAWQAEENNKRGVQA